MVLGQAQSLKQKQKIPMKHAAVLIGVMDQEPVPGIDNDPAFEFSGELGENEVFIQIERSSFSRVRHQRMLSKAMN